jgi:2-(1,2-epoxy-1,2-dihydrophenyl)acetyl-CoA isomerase
LKKNTKETHLNDSTKTQPLVLQGEGPVLLTLHEGGVAHVRLNRAESANGLNIELLKALHEVLMQVHGDGRVRAVLITGAGKNFCAGGDVHTFLSKGEQLPDYIRVATSYLQLVASLLIRLNPPVVSAVQGFAAGGGGMGLVCSSDFVVAGESAKFLAGATRVGMVPDAGVSVTLTQLVGLRKATEILMLNPVITAPEAREMGLITRVVPDAKLEDEALALARELALGAPAALANTKRLLWSGIGQGVEAAMPEENNTQAMLSGMADALEGLAAVIEKRTPRFTGR